MSNVTTSSNDAIDLPALNCPSIIVVVEGSGECENLTSNSSYEPNRTLNRGDIFYISPGQKVRLNVNAIQLNFNGQNSRPTAGKHRFLAYRTFSYGTGPDHSNRLVKSLISVKNIASAPVLNAATIESMTINDNNDSIKLMKKMNANNGVKHLNRPEMLFNVESEMDGFL